MQLSPIAKVVGQTPAAGVAVEWKLKTAEYPMSDSFVFDYFTANAQSKTIIPSGESIPIWEQEIIISASEATEINSGTKRIYAVGTALYRDSFSGGRWTNFCFSSGLKDINKTWETCPIHNGTDWDIAVTPDNPTKFTVPMR